MPVATDHDSSDGTATKQFLITEIIFHGQINIVEWNTKTPASQNDVKLSIIFERALIL